MKPYLEVANMDPAVRDVLASLTLEAFLSMTVDEFGAAGAGLLAFDCQLPAR